MSAESIKEGWHIPYIDAPLSFWQELKARYGAYINEVYFPVALDSVGSGRPLQPSRYLEEFLEASLLPASVLVNPIILGRPVESLAPLIITELKRMHSEYGIASVTISNCALAESIRKNIPGLTIAASVLLDICSPLQVQMLKGSFDVLVPSSRVMRNIPALEALKKAFPGKIRLMVNEGCLPGCTFRVQHFYEMANGTAYPGSLCARIIRQEPWLRLTGSWVLPQHLHLYAGIYDELKLCGRVTLQEPDVYRYVLSSYIFRKETGPHRIGGGPAALHRYIKIEETFFKKTLYCAHACHTCTVCRDYYIKCLFKAR